MEKRWRRYLKSAGIITVLVGIGVLLALPLKLKSETAGLIVQPSEIPIEKYEAAIIFGAGVREDGIPRDMLADRLKTGAALYNEGKVKKLIVSGNNSAESFYETDVMREFLVEELGVPEQDIEEDPYGNRTYDTCARAKEVLGLEAAILVTQEYHLYRALRLCNALGVRSIGVSATLRDYELEFFFKFREFFASHKALIDLYLVEPYYRK